MATIINTETIDELDASFVGRNDLVNRWGNINFQNICPGLVGYWPFSNIQRSTGNVGDMSNSIVLQNLTNNNGVTFPIHNNLMPYANFVGASNQSLSVADNTDLDILGTETQYPNPGLTIITWIRPADATPVSAEVFLSKFIVADRSYELVNLSSGVVRFTISTDGVSSVNLSSSNTMSDNIWSCVGCIFTPSTSMEIFLDGIWTPDTTGIPASIFNSASTFRLGSRSNGSFYFTGDLAQVVLMANAVDRSFVEAIWQQTRVIFGR